MCVPLTRCPLPADPENLSDIGFSQLENLRGVRESAIHPSPLHAVGRSPSMAYVSDSRALFCSRSCRWAVTDGQVRPPHALVTHTHTHTHCAIYGGVGATPHATSCCRALRELAKALRIEPQRAAVRTVAIAAQYFPAIAVRSGRHGVRVCTTHAVRPLCQAEEYLPVERIEPVRSLSAALRCSTTLRHSTVHHGSVQYNVVLTGTCLHTALP
jgi:hypothetical protein